ncbi:MAG TPA: hypothetical protein VHS97_00690 [Isosphaeraceae bacterium]|nr:hypothetical protein [Isosphaeraceae bacterium]
MRFCETGMPLEDRPIDFDADGRFVRLKAAGLFHLVDKAKPLGTCHFGGERRPAGLVAGLVCRRHDQDRQGADPVAVRHDCLEPTPKIVQNRRRLDRTADRWVDELMTEGKRGRTVQPVFADKLIGQVVEGRAQRGPVGDSRQPEACSLILPPLSLLFEASGELIVPRVDDDRIRTPGQPCQLFVLHLQRISRIGQDLARETTVGDRLLQLPGHDLAYRQPRPVGLSHRARTTEDHNPVFAGGILDKSRRQRRKPMRPASPGRRTNLEHEERNQARQSEKEAALQSALELAASPWAGKERREHRRSYETGEKDRAVDDQYGL